MKFKLKSHLSIKATVKILTFCLAPGFSIGCGKASKPSLVPVTEKPRALIMTVNAPLQYLAEQLVDTSWAEVVFPASPETTDPAYWHPTSEQILQYQKADLILLNGAGYARWLETTSLPVSKLLNTSLAFKEQWIATGQALVHQHGPEGKHSHDGFASTTWLDFGLLQRQAQAIYEACKQKWPLHAASLDRNHASLIQDLTSLDIAMQRMQSDIGNKPMLASHPVYQYMARAYSLNLHSLHWEPDQMPPESDWDTLDAWLQINPTHWMLWEETPHEEIQRRLKKRAITWVVVRPQGGRPSTGTFLDSMRTNITNLESLLQ
jgi:zinc transport system substrate-binding protein